jgi:predicted PhzF superfamily epimerase YddE/YHI9
VRASPRFKSCQDVGVAAGRTDRFPHGPAVDVVRVFCDADGQHGNPLGVVRDGSALPGRVERQAFATELGVSETVYVDDSDRGIVDIYTPSVRLPFAGHPVVGVASLLRVPELVTAAGRVPVRFDGELTYVAALTSWAPVRTLRRCVSPEHVQTLPVPPAGEWIYAWAWADERAGRVRARAFPGRGDGIDEDEATGAAAILLTAHLGRPLHIVQGRGSHLHTALLPDDWVEVGGRVHPTPTG